MILLDTTVLVYAVGVDHPLRDPCRGVVERVGAGALTATTTVEVIQEFAHVRARRRSVGDAARLARGYIDLFAPLCSPDADDLRDGLRLFERDDSVGAFDAVLAATAINSERIEALVSADGAFGSIEGLNHLHPSDLRS